MKFTTKERDAETGLDYFGARYFSSSQGRFTSPDWSATPEPVPYADLRDPQTLNLYSYVRNNPLAKRDEDGHCTVDGENHIGWCLWHSLGFYQSGKEKAAAVQKEADADRAAMGQWHGFTINGQNPADVAKSGTNQDVISAYKSGSNFLLGVGQGALMPCRPGIQCGVVPMIEGQPVFRGGPNLTARLGIDVKVGADGLIQPGRGISVSLDAGSLERFGGARQVVSMPDELELVQRGGNASHYEITPKQPMSAQRFQELLNQVKLKE